MSMGDRIWVCMLISIYLLPWGGGGGGGVLEGTNKTDNTVWEGL